MTKPESGGRASRAQAGSEAIPDHGPGEGADGTSLVLTSRVVAIAFLGVVLASLALRPAVTSLPPLFAEVRDGVGSGALFISFLAMAPPMIFAVSGATTPRVVARRGLELGTALAMAACAIGLAGRALSGEATAMAIFTAAALWGMGVANVTLPALVRLYFPHRVGVATTVYIAALQLGTLIPALVAVPVADHTNWRMSLGMWTGVPALALLPWLVLHRRRRGDRGSAARGRSGRTVQAWRSSLGLSLALLMGTSSLITYTMFAWIPSVLLAAGDGRGHAGSMLAFFAALGLPPSLIIPQIVARVRDPYVVVLASAAAYTSGLLGLWLAPLDHTIVWILLAGLGTSVFPLSLALIATRARTVTGVAALSAFAQGAGYLLASVGPFAFGLLNEATGSWSASFVLLLVSVLVMAVSGRVCCRPGFIEERGTWSAGAAKI